MDNDSAQISLTKLQSSMIKDACEAKMWAIAWHIAECLENRAKALATPADPVTAATPWISQTFTPQTLDFSAEEAQYHAWADLYVTAHNQSDDYASADAYVRAYPLVEAVERASNRIRA